jgi:hypothetical protein
MACEPNLIYCAYFPTVAVETASTKGARNSCPTARSTDMEQRISQMECVKQKSCQEQIRHEDG